MLIAGGTQDEMTEFKKEYITDRVYESIRLNGHNPGFFSSVLTQAIDILKKFQRFLMFRQEKAEKNAAAPTEEKQIVPVQKEQHAEPVDPAELQHARANYLRLQSMHNDLDALNKKIYAIDKTIQKLNRQRKTFENSFADKVLHAFERKELNKKIAAEKAKLNHAKQELERYPPQHGFGSVRFIEEAYQRATNKYDALFEQDGAYNISCAAEKAKQVNDNSIKAEEVIHTRVSLRQPTARKKSILKNLAEKQQLVEETSHTKRDQSHRINRRKGIEL